MNQLSNLEQLVNTTGQTDLSTILKDEKNKIIDEWQEFIYLPADQQEKYIHLYQYKLLWLMEIVAGQFPPETFTTGQTHSPLIQLYFTLHELFVRLEENYPSFFDLNCHIPLVHLLVARKDLERELPLLRQLLSGTGLMDIILAPFEEILQSDNISFHRLYYIRKLSASLQNLDPDGPLERVESILVYMNFNNSAYLNYKLKLLSDNISSLPTVHQQLMHTKWLVKMNNQQQMSLGVQYDCNRPSLKEQINEWLMHESDYLEHKILHPQDKLLPEEVSPWYNFKVKVDLSVNELAFLLRLMMEHGLILNNNKSELADFFARYFATNNQAAISADSLRTKMYSYSPSSVESVMQLLLDLFHTSKRIKSD